MLDSHDVHPSGRPRRVFISYAREDLEWAKETFRYCRSLDQDCFLDVESLRAGDHWPERLRDEVRRADLVWVGWSRHAAQSEWVLKEYTEALAVAAARGIRRSPLIDLLDSTPLADALKHIQAERSALAAGDEDRLLRSLRILPAGPTPPSFLLRPEFGVVPFWGREETLGDLRSWCLSDRPFDLLLFVGEGGMGKTRLAAELCKRMTREGWDARFLDESELLEACVTRPERLEALLRPRRPRLVILDYAEARRSELAALLRKASRRASSMPFRVLALARRGGDWWDELTRNDPDIQLVAGGWSCRHLEALAPKLEQRLELYSRAGEAFAIWLSLPLPSRVPDLSAQRFERILMVQAAALAGVMSETHEDHELETLLEHEERYIRRLAGAQGIEPTITRQLLSLLALVTLAGGCSSGEEIGRFIESCPELDGIQPMQVRAVAGLLLGHYGTANRIEALEPDLLGEALVAREIEGRFELARRFFSDSSPEQTRRGLNVLNRIARRRDVACGWLLGILESNRERLSLEVIQVAAETGDPIGKLLADSLERRPDASLCRELVGELPVRTVALRELALVVTRQALEDAGLTSRARAQLLNNLGLRLNDIGRREEAAKAVDEAVDIYRSLAKSSSDILPDLAMSLNNQGNGLSRLGRRDEALQATEEAVEIYRSLAVSHPDAFLPDLARSLNSLGNRLSDLGRRDEALKAMEEAVVIRRSLAKSHPEVFLPDLAKSLNNLGYSLSDVGRKEDALMVAKEALAIRRSLARSRPDAFLPELAMSLNNMGNRLTDVGRNEEALKVTEEALEIRRCLASSRPDAFLPDVAMSMYNLGTRLWALDKKEEALRATEDGLEKLLPFFERNQAAFGERLTLVVKNYRQYSEARGKEPKQDLLERIEVASRRAAMESGQQVDKS